MFTWQMGSVVDMIWQPFLLLGGSTLLANYFTKRERTGAALLTTIGGILIFVFLWLFPMLDRLSWLFTGILSLY